MKKLHMGRIRAKYLAKKPRINGRKIDVWKAAEIYELGKHNLSPTEVASWYDVTPAMVCHIWEGRHWKGCSEVVAFLKEQIAS